MTTEQRLAAHGLALGAPDWHGRRAVTTSDGATVAVCTDKQAVALADLLDAQSNAADKP